MENLFYLMDVNTASGFCSSPAIGNIMYLVGVVVAVIRIAVPIILIVIGMTDLIKAITSQDDKQIKQATTLLVKKVVIGVAVFLVPTIISLLLTVINQSDQTNLTCWKCATNVWGQECSWQD